MARYILDIILGTLIGFPIMTIFLSVIFGIIYYLIYPNRANKAYDLTVYGISLSLTALIFIIILLLPVIIISYLLRCSSPSI